MRHWGVAILKLAIACTAAPLIIGIGVASAFTLVGAARERGTESNGALVPCRIPQSLDGNCANYRWYNACSGYIWLYKLQPGEAVGVAFGGPQQPCVAPGNIVRRVITYYRNVTYSYGQCTIDVFLDGDQDADGCPDGIIARQPCLDPGERWNCSNFNATIPAGVRNVIVREVSLSYYSPRFVTDGPYSEACDPVGQGHSFYYGMNGATCQPWRGPTGRKDNFFAWLIVDRGVSIATEQMSWGKIKGLYQ